MKYAFFLFLTLMSLTLTACATPQDTQTLSMEETVTTCAQPIMLPKPAITFDEILVRYYEQGYLAVSYCNIDTQDQAMNAARDMGICLVLYPSAEQDNLVIFLLQISEKEKMPFLHGELVHAPQSGVEVMAIRAGSLPERYGLAKGDIVHKINGTLVVDQGTDLNPLILYGATNTLEIFRNGQSMTIKIPLPRN